MKQLPVFIEDKFFNFLNGTISIAKFESWVYITCSLEHILSDDDYLSLISLDFSKFRSKSEIDKILRRYINAGKYETWKLRNLLLAFIHEERNPMEMLSDFYDLYCHGYYFLDNLGLGYGICALEAWAEFNQELSEKSISEEQRKYSISVRYEAIEEAQKVLSWLETHKIVIITAQDDIDDFSIIDTRTDEEKQPTWHRVADSNTQKSEPWWKFW